VNYSADDSCVVSVTVMHLAQFDLQQQLTAVNSKDNFYGVDDLHL